MVAGWRVERDEGRRVTSDNFDKWIAVFSWQHLSEVGVSDFEL